MLRAESLSPPTDGSDSHHFNNNNRRMSNDDEPFVLPAGRRKGRNRRRNAAPEENSFSVTSNNSHYYLQPKRCSLQKLLSVLSMETVKELAAKTEQKLISLMAPDECSSIREIVIYGIGSFMTCHMARTQLSLICALRGRIMTSSQIRTLAFDPILKQEDYRLLQQELDIDPILENEACMRSIQNTSGKVLFFMPHLDKELYSNLLSANWHKGSLKRLLILGNSFTNMSESQPIRIVRSECPFVFHAVKLGVVREQKLDFIDDFDDSLNDLSLHAFNCDQVSEDEMSVAELPAIMEGLQVRAAAVSASS